MNELVDRKPEGEREGIWHTYTKENGDKFSVVNIGKLMQTAPSVEEMRKMGVFLGWEAMRIIKNIAHEQEELSYEPIRARTWEELKKLL